MSAINELNELQPALVTERTEDTRKRKNGQIESMDDYIEKMHPDQFKEIMKILNQFVTA